MNKTLGMPKCSATIDNPDTPKQTIPYCLKKTLKASATMKQPNANKKYRLTKFFFSTFSNIFSILFLLNFLKNILSHL